jgi:serine phosphatase RsbU (regulator of sigma subunit)
MKSNSTALGLVTDNDLNSLAEQRGLIEELQRTVIPFALATKLTLAYVSRQTTHWLTACRGCQCSQSGVIARECLDRPRLERICHLIKLSPDDAAADCIIVCCGLNEADLPVAIEHMVRSITRQIEMGKEQEQLLEELSACWESLEAVYDISSDLDLLGKPHELLERIINRAASYRNGLKVILWIDREGMLYPSAKGLAAPSPRRREGGLIEKVMSERNGIILNGGALIVMQNDLEPEFRAAANLALVPLTSRQCSFGALAVWQEEDFGDFDSYDMRFLAALTLQAAMVVEIDRLHRSSLESERLQQEIEIGSKIQQILLLGQVPGDVPGVKVAALCIPSQMIGGDFYDFIRPHDRCLDVICGDVMGKGIPAALIGAAIKAHFLRAMSQLLSSPTRPFLPEPHEIVACVHALLIKQLIHIESFVTLCYARFDLEQRRAYIVDCGHTKTVRYRPRLGRCDLLQGVNLPIGFSEQENYLQLSFELEAGDLFIFYSDGLTETMNATGELFGEHRLMEFVSSHSMLGPEELVAKIHYIMSAFAGKETLADDLTCVAVKITESGHRAQPKLKIMPDRAFGSILYRSCIPEHPPNSELPEEALRYPFTPHIARIESS